jgi:hypothetical protein
MEICFVILSCAGSILGDHVGCHYDGPREAGLVPLLSFMPCTYRKEPAGQFWSLQLVVLCS